jgi:hypothetical protein
VSLIWAGVLAVVIHQVYPFVRTIVKVWTVASQYNVWQSKL